MSIVYHYCSIEKFKGILQSKSLWLTPADTMNDYREIVTLYLNIYEELKTALLKYFNNDPWLQEQLKAMEQDLWLIDAHKNENLNPNDPKYCITYSTVPNITSFCLRENNLNAWNLYGDNLKGIAIGFDLSKFNIPAFPPHPNTKIEHSIGLSQVFYNKSQQFNMLFEPLIRELSEELSKGVCERNPITWIGIRCGLKRYSAIFKDDSWRTEEEVRLIYYPCKEHTMTKNFISGPYPYKKEFSSGEIVSGDRYNLNWYTAPNEHSIENLYIGNNCEYSSVQIKELLKQSDVHVPEHKIHIPEIHIR